MKTMKNRYPKIVMLTIISFLMTAVLALSGVGIYLKLTYKPKSPELVVNPLDFSVDAWDGQVVDTTLEENYAGRGSFSKTINSASSFVHFINEVNNGNSFEGYTIYLNTSIDFGGHEIPSIGNDNNAFKGTFDGGYYTLMNAKIKGASLFGRVENATIKNVGLYNCNANLIEKAVNSNIENSFVRMGQGNLVFDYISNDGTHYIKNSFVDSNVNGLIGKIDTNNSSENEVLISNCYYTQGVKTVNEKVGEAYIVETDVIIANKNQFVSWNYSEEYSSNVDWCDYDYLENSKRLAFNYPVQSGFVKVYLTGSCYEGVVELGDEFVNITNLSEAFEIADQQTEAQINLIVEKIFMQAQAEVENNTTVNINAVQDTTIVRGSNNAGSMFVGSGNSKIVLGTNPNNEIQGASSALSTDSATITLDGNREYVENNNLKSDAMIVVNGSEIEINNNVKLKNNINNTTKYGGAILMLNANENSILDVTIENCHAEIGGGAAAIVGGNSVDVPSAKNCSAKLGGAIYVTDSLDSQTVDIINKQYGSHFGINAVEHEDYSSTQTISGRTYDSCSAEHGGALFGPSFLVGDSVFTNCTATGSGGAIATSQNVIIQAAVEFVQNSANLGGAISANDSVIVAGGASEYIVKFEKNQAVGTGAKGGAIVAVNKVSAQTGSYEMNFISNSTDSEGGAIYTYGSVDQASAGPSWAFEGNTDTSGVGIGGAIYASGKVSLNDFSFRNNIAGSAGAIKCAKLNLGAGTFYQNGSMSGGCAGAVYATDVTMTGGVYFDTNTAGNGGAGAIYASGDVTISGYAEFMENTSYGEGGAIYAEGKVTISSQASFYTNSADYGGGAIYAIGDVEINVPNATINTVQFFGNSTDTGTGGAIYSESSVSVASCTFKSNHANNGGAIDCKDITIGTASFEDNSTLSAGDGGAVRAEYVTITGDTSFVGNAADNNGGAINASYDVKVTGDARFDGNTAIGHEDSSGGVISAGGDVEITGGDVSIKNNQSNRGCAIYSEGSVIVGAGAAFDANKADVIPSYGGAIYAVGDVEVCGALFTNHTAAHGGIINAEGDVTIVGAATFDTVDAMDAMILAQTVKISGNSVFKNSGDNVILASTVVIDGDPTFTDNTALVIDVESGDVIINGNPTFTENSAGVIKTNGGNVTINGSPTFTSNNSTSYGGAIYASNGDVIINGSPTFTSNNSDSEGGAIYAKNITFGTDSAARFELNSATSHGGAIAYTGEMTIDGNPQFVGNVSTTMWGGAIYDKQNENTVLTINGSPLFENNKSNSKYGGAISAKKVRINGDPSFVSNYAYWGGSAIHIGTSLEINGDPIFRSNTTYSGGAVGSSSSANDVAPDVTISGNPKFIANTSTLGDAAAICLNMNNTSDPSVLTISGNPVFESNKAEYSKDVYGGAICVSSVIISGNPDFVSNSALSSCNDHTYKAYGGAIYAKQSVEVLAGANPLFQGNTSDCGDGGAIFAPTVTLNGGTFINNVAGNRGGAVDATTVNINGKTIFRKNAALNDAGAIWATNVNITAETIFSENVITDSNVQYGAAIYSSQSLNITGPVTLYNNNYENSSVDSAGEIYVGGEFNLGKGLNILTDLENIAAIYLDDGKFINVTGDIYAPHTVYMNNPSAGETVWAYESGATINPERNYPFRVINASGLVVEGTSSEPLYDLVSGSSNDYKITVTPKYSQQPSCTTREYEIATNFNGVLSWDETTGYQAHISNYSNDYSMEAGTPVVIVVDNSNANHNVPFRIKVTDSFGVSAYEEIYIQYQPATTIFDANGGTMLIEGETVEKWEIETGFGTSFEAYMSAFPVATRHGYSFDGWYGYNYFNAEIEQGTFKSETGEVSLSTWATHLTRVRSSRDLWLTAGWYKILATATDETGKEITLSTFVDAYDYMGRHLTDSSSTEWTEGLCKFRIKDDAYVKFAFKIDDSTEISPDLDYTIILQPSGETDTSSVNLRKFTLDDWPNYDGAEAILKAKWTADTIDPPDILDQTLFYMGDTKVVGYKALGGSGHFTYSCNDTKIRVSTDPNSSYAEAFEYVSTDGDIYIYFDTSLRDCVDSVNLVTVSITDDINGEEAKVSFKVPLIYPTLTAELEDYEPKVYTYKPLYGTLNDANSDEAIVLDASSAGYHWGNNFLGWFTEKTGGDMVVAKDGTLVAGIEGWTLDDATWALTQNGTLYGLWEPKELILTLDADGGYFTFDGGTTRYETYEMTVTFGESYPDIPEPVREGYNFAGWDCEYDITDNKPVEAVVDHTAVAMWDRITLSITVRGDGHSNHNGETLQDPVTYPVYYGSDFTVDWTPKEGYKTVRVIVDGEDIVAEELEHSIINEEYNFSNVTESHEIYIECELIEYTITIVVGANGDVNPPEKNVVVKHFDDYTIEFVPNPGYHVSKITIDDEDLTGPSFDNAVLNGYTFYSIDSDHTVYVEFEISTIEITLKNNYTVTDETIYETISQEYNTTIEWPADPVRDGYEFGGWFRDREGLVAHGLTKMPAEDITLYAKWTVRSFKVIYHYNFDDLIYLEVPVDYGAKIEEPLDPEREGYAFGGWYTTPNCSTGEEFDFENETMPAHDLPLYAKWIAKTTIVRFGNLSGTGQEGSVMGYAVTESNFDNYYYSETYSFGDTITLERSGNETITYTFSKWVKGQSSAGADIGTSYTITAEDCEVGAIYLTACYQYEVSLVTVTNNRETSVIGGVVKANGETNRCVGYYHPTTSQVTITAIANENSRFIGWYLDSTCTEQLIVNGNPITSETYEFDMLGGTKGSVCYYAKFLSLSTVTINPNGGKYDGSTENVQLGDYTYGHEETLKTPTLDNYSFGGWSLTGGGENASILGNVYTFGTEDATLTAIWNINEQTLKINYVEDKTNANHSANIVVSTETVGCVIDANPSTLSKGESVEVTHNYDEIVSCEIKISIERTSEMISYYLYVDGTQYDVGKYNDTHSDEIIYTWTPTSDKEIEVYIVEYHSVTALKEEGIDSVTFTVYDFDDQVVDSDLTSYIVINGYTVEFVADLADGYENISWHDAYDQLIQTSPTYETIPDGDITITAKADVKTFKLVAHAGSVDSYTKVDTSVEVYEANKYYKYQVDEYVLVSDTIQPTDWLIEDYFTLEVLTATFNLTGYPEWTLDEFDSSIASKEVSYLNYLGDLPTPVIPGFNLVDWYKEETFNTKVDNYSRMPLNGLDIYAKWESKTYIVKFAANKPTDAVAAVSGHMADLTFVYDVYYVLPGCSYSIDGYTFSGWNYTNGDGDEFTLSGHSYVKNLTVADSITLYAVWNLHTYTVSYDGNGSTNGEMTPDTYTYNENKALSKNLYEKTGSTFTGWNTQLNGTGTAYYDEQVVGQLTKTNGAEVKLYAQWATSAYRLIYDYNYDGVEDSIHTYAYGAQIVKIANPTREGYVFGGWYTTANWELGKKFNFTNATMPAENKTLYAKWTEDDDIGGSRRIDIYIQPGENAFILIGSYKASDSSDMYKYTIKDMSYECFKLSETDNATEWSDLANELDLTNETAYLYFTGAPVGTYSCYIQATDEFNNEILKSETFIVNVYYRELRLFNDSNVATQTLYTEYNTTNVYVGNQSDQLTSIRRPDVRDGYTFQGWYTELVGGTRVIKNDTSLVENISGWTTADAKWAMTSNSSLFEKWTANTYTVSFNALGMVENPSDIIVTYGEPYGILPSPSKAGHSFDGWYCDGVKIESSTIVSKLEDHILTASWSVVDFNLPTLVVAQTDLIYGSFEEIELVKFKATGGSGLFKYEINSDTIAQFRLSTTESTDQEVSLYLTNVVQAKRYSCKIKITDVGTGSDATTNEVVVNVYYPELELDDNDPTTENQKVYPKYNTTLMFDGSQSAIEAEIIKPTKAGYKFTGWFALDGTKIIDDSGNLINNWNLLTNSILFAQWDELELEVTLNPNGGVMPAGSEKVIVTYNATYAGLPEPNVRKGYTFDYWTLDGAEVTSSTVVTKTENHELIAHWTPNPVEAPIISQYNFEFVYDGSSKDLVTFKANGGSGDFIYTINSLQASNFNLSIYVATNSEVTLSLVNVTSAGTYTCVIDVEDDVNGLKTSTEMFTVVVYYPELELDDNDDSTSNKKVYPKYGTSSIYTTSEGVNPTTFEVPAKEGYTFEGWATQEGVVVVDKTGRLVASVENWTTPFGTWTITSDNKLFETWKIEANVLIYELNGGSFEDGISTIVPLEFNAEIIKPKDPTRNGYKFAGWYTTALCKDGEEFNFTDARMPAESLTLYAKWDNIEHNITITSETRGGENGGTFNPSSPFTLTCEETQVVIITPSRGYLVTGITIVSDDGTTELSQTEIESAVSYGYTFSEVLSDHTMNIVFSRIAYTISTTVIGNGTIKVGDKTLGTTDSVGVYEEGSQTFIFVPMVGYFVKSIKVDSSYLSGDTLTNAINNGLTLDNVTANHTVQVTFAIHQYKVTLAVDGDGYGKVHNANGADLQKVNHGESREFTLEVDLSNYAVEIFINGKQVYINGKTLKLENIDQDMHIEVRFTKKSFFETKMGIITIVSGIVALSLMTVGITVFRKIQKKKRQRLI